jgi:hypothetical protein
MLNSGSLFSSVLHFPSLGMNPDNPTTEVIVQKESNKKERTKHENQNEKQQSADVS